MRDFYKKYSVLIDNFIWLTWAVLYAFCFPTYGFSVSIWFVFVPVLLFAYNKPIRTTAMYSYLYSIPFWLITLFWLTAFHPVSMPFITPIYSLYIAFAFIVVAYVAKKKPGLRWIVLPLVFVSMELLRSTGYTGFKWNLVGDSMFKNPIFLQFCDIFGVWGLSAVILLCNTVIAEFIQSWIEQKDIKGAFKKSWPKLATFGVVFSFVVIYGAVQYNHYSQMSKDAPKTKIALIQPDNDSFSSFWKDRMKYYSEYWKLNAEAALHNPDLIVWSESMLRNYVWGFLNSYPENVKYSQLDSVYQSHAAKRWGERAGYNLLYYNMPKEFDTPIVITHPEFRTEPDPYGRKKHSRVLYNTADYIDPKIDLIQSYSKIHLTPFGEWMPYYWVIPGVKEMIDSLGAAAYFPAKTFKVIKTRKGKFAILICFEDVFGLMARKFILLGVNYFVNTTNDGWAYHWSTGSHMPLWQHVASVVTMAVSVRRPIARAVNTGVTCVVNLNGDIDVSDTPLYEQGYYVTELPIIDENLKTIYVRFGYLFPYILVILSIAVFAYAAFFRKRSPKLKS